MEEQERGADRGETERRPLDFNWGQAVTLKEYIFTAVPRGDGRVALHVWNQTDAMPYAVGDMIEYRQWGTWEVEEVQTEPRRILLLRRATPTRS